nr:putative ribonuclease H-like domain-containing protein [Tanacetum cinerariifolium]
RVLRENNMYNVDLKNVVPSGDLTCLFAKATLDESNLWHRRLEYINFKTMNKLVKFNLVRGSPSKVFENNHTCVACKKGKQHRASCKFKPISSVSHPSQRLHMDLFGSTFVKSLNKKSYSLVVTDDYSGISWVFFLATKDETSGILKTFITGIENQVNHKVKILRRDNGIEFKNHDLTQFCGIKRIKREFSVARTPQQNRVAKRNNRTLIEAARTMLADSLLPIPFWAESMNYQPVVAGNQPNHNAGIKENLDAGKVGKETKYAQQYMLLPLWSTGSQDSQNTDTDAAFDVKRMRIKFMFLQVVVTSQRSMMKRLKENLKERVMVNAASAPVTIIGPNPTNSTKSFNAASPFDNVVSPNFLIGGKSSFVDPSQYLALYGLHQAPRAWYATLANYLLENGFQRGKIDQTLFIKKQKGDILQVQMSSMGELAFFLGLQVKQKDDRIFISQDKYVAEILRKFGFTDVKSTSTPIETEQPLLKDPDGEDIDVHIYRLMIGSLMYLTLSKPDIMFAICFWATTSIKKTNDVVKLQALIDRKKVVVTGDIIHQDLPLDDANGVECFPTEEFFAELARMGYEKPPPKLTFYKAFFLAQWKFLIHILVQCVTVKRTTWNEFSCSMAFTVICVAIGRKFNFSKYIFDSMVRNVDSPSKFLMGMHPNRGRIKAIDADEDITLVDAETQVDLGAKLQGRKNDDNATAKENIDWNVVAEQIQEKDLDNIRKYQSLKRKQISIAQARKNMIIYLKNMAGYKIEHFIDCEMAMDLVMKIFMETNEPKSRSLDTTSK